MTLYKILGTDQREYGPVPAEVVCQWVNEGRANAKTMVKAEGTEDWRPLSTVAELSRAIPAPPALPPGGTAPTTANSGLNKVIPYRNIPALAGYYCAVFALIPILGLLLGPVAVALGVAGLRAARRNPAAGGKIHSWVGIVLGSVCALGYLALVLVILRASRF